MKNKKIVWIVIGIVSVALIALAITYAYWQITASQQGVNEISSACLDISLVDAESGNTGVTLQDQYPLSDTEGAKLKPYKFTVTNNCDTAVDYQIALESIGDSISALKATSLKVMLDDKTSLLSANDVVTPTVSGAYASHKLGMGTLAKSGDEGSSINHELRLWIDEAAPVSENNKTYNGKITATIGQGISNFVSLKDTLLAVYGGESAITELDSNVFETPTGESDAGMYKMEDDYGISYYYRGNVTNNYVQFGSYAAGTTVNGQTYDEETPIYWRVVRINGDGTIRMIYDGTSLVENGITHAATIGSTKYASSVSDAKYVGYVYDEVNTSSKVKTEVDTWYTDNIATNYGKYIADSIFCNDREVTLSQSYDPYTLYQYGAYDRLYTNKRPQLTCTQDEDKLTVANGKLTKSIGLITADEIALAGGVYNTINKTYYLYSGSSYWSMTPSSHSGTSMSMWGVSASGSLYFVSIPLSDVRPVINIEADTLFTGSGTVIDPYRLAE